jgi:hypothetical protein
VISEEAIFRDRSYCEMPQCLGKAVNALIVNREAVLGLQLERRRGPCFGEQVLQGRSGNMHVYAIQGIATFDLICGL